jgi:hypothetical protein
MAALLLIRFIRTRLQPGAYSGQTPSRIENNMSMTEQAYIAAYQKIAGKYENNQSTMEDYLEAMKKLKESYLKGRTETTLPAVP